MRIEGKEIADHIYADLKDRRSHMARSPRLGILVASSGPVVESFVKIKSKVADELGVEIIRKDLTPNDGTEAAIDAVRDLASTTDAVIMQLPTFAGIDINAVLSSIAVEKDVDGISPLGNDGDRPVEAPVARAVMEILRFAHVHPKGKRAVVVGAGRLVGSPTAAMLKREGADVSIVTLEHGSLDDLKDADIVVLGAGNPGFIKPEHLKQGVTLIDAGTSEMAGVIRGDADPACESKASVFTPVPGGVGPIAVAMIFKNLFELFDMNAATS